jgi:plastocyanin
MRKSQRISTALLSLTLAVGVGACGSDGDGDDAAAGGAGTTTTGAVQPAPEPVRTDAVAIADFAFSPERVAAAAGTTVTWTNGDGFAHSVVATDDSFRSEDLNPDDTFPHTFSEPGTYRYMCGIHNSMTGSVTVT